MIGTITFLKIICISIIVIFLLLLAADKIADHFFVWDYADVLFAKPYKSFKVKTYEEIQNILEKYPNRQISIAGGKFSHGGQTFKEGNIYLDMIDLNKIVCFDKEKKEITVQAGTTWRSLLEFLDSHNLSVKAMQSYANFTVGGSVSVNAHGRGTEYSTVGSSLKALRVMLMCPNQGSIVVIKPGDELFRAVLGGYGGIAIILEATLSLTDNYLMRKVVKHVTASPETIYETFRILQGSNNGTLYNGLIYPQRRGDLFNITYERVPLDPRPEQHVVPAGFTTLAKGSIEKLQPIQSYYWGPMLLEQILRRSTILKYCRAYLEPYFTHNEPFGVLDHNEIAVGDLIWRNWELSYDTNKHRSLVRFPTTTALQEYFIPIDKMAIDIFFDAFNRITESYNVNLMNISLRYVRSPAYLGFHPILDYAPKDRIPVVIYYNLLNNPYSLENAKKWTQEVLDVVLDPRIMGSYYLPYLDLARPDQFRRAYPDYEQYLFMKKKYDPTNRLTSKFLDDYILHN